MRSLVLSALPRARGYRAAATVAANIQACATRRTFSCLPSLRPTIPTSNSPSSTIFRSPSTHNGLLSSFAPSPTASGLAPDLVPKTSVTSHPALGLGAQVRFAPRPNMARTSRLKRKRRHGFLSRLRSRDGRKTLQRRKDKKRTLLTN
ncbi:hypothetical protein F5Y05DRAFT_181987 [Hypoxylon sp. FL0543]|nr:hypothetical protein F5Y05DRAFT_181987 [Hypoxylon sp. FL0543]